MAEVHLDAPSGGFVTIDEQGLAGGMPTGKGRIIAPEHGQRHEFGDLRTRGSMRLVELRKTCCRFIERGEGLFHLAFGERSDASGPGSERLNLRISQVVGKRGERGGGGYGLNRLIAPGSEAAIFKFVREL
jgi:hypothetical protein